MMRTSIKKFITSKTAVTSLLFLNNSKLLTGYFQVYGVYIPGMEEAMQKYNLPGRLYPALSIMSVFAGPVIVLLGGMLAAIYPAVRLYTLAPVSAMRAV